MQTGYTLIHDEVEQPARLRRSSRNVAATSAALLSIVGILGALYGLGPDAEELLAIEGGVSMWADPRRSTGIAFCGGGFRAHAVGIGWLAGLVSGTKQPISDILKMDAVASNSGGSWFAASLLYSANFNAMMEEMGNDPGRAANIFQVRWGANWKQISWNSTRLPEKVGCCLTRHHTPCMLRMGYSDTIQLDGVEYCCPSDVTGDCKIKHSLPCWRRPKEVLFGDTQYCCADDDDSADKFNRGEGCLDTTLTQNLFSAVGYMSQTLRWFLFNQQADYDTIIGEMLGIPGDMNAADPLTAKPVDWARGKDFLVAQSLLVPAPPGDVLMRIEKTSFMHAQGVMAQAAPDSAEVLKSWPCWGKLCASQVPARFSVTLGTKSSPIAITSEASRSALHMTYKKDEKNTWTFWHKWSVTEESQSSTHVSNWQNSHDVPILSAVGGSSALLGSLNVVFPRRLKEAYMLSSKLRSLLPVWIQDRLTGGEVPFMAEAESLDSSNFQAAKDLLGKGPGSHELSAADVARKHVMEITDAGQIDNTAICHLLSAGHTNVVSIYNSAGFAPQKLDVMKSFHQLLSGSPSTVTAASGYPIFKEGMHEVARQLATFDSVRAVDGSTQLAAIWAGELHLETVDSPPHGIRGAQPITVRMVIVDGVDISCCSLDIDLYAIFIGDIVKTFSANPDFAWKLSRWFSGA